MDMVDEFRKHAAECRQAAESAKDPTDRAQWLRLAGRWESCLEVAKASLAAAQNARLSREAGQKRSLH
jgi:hypothetical protein